MTSAKGLLGPLCDLPARRGQQAAHDTLSHVIQGVQERLYVSGAAAERVGEG